MLGRRNSLAHNSEVDCRIHDRVHDLPKDLLRDPLRDPSVGMNGEDVGLGRGRGRRPAIPRWIPHFLAQLAAAIGGLSYENGDVHDREGLVDDWNDDGANFLGGTLQQADDDDWMFWVSRQNPMALSHLGIKPSPLSPLQENQCSPDCLLPTTVIGALPCP